MADNDDDYTPTETVQDSSPAANLRRRKPPASTEVVPAKKAKKQCFEPKTSQARIPNNLRSVSAMKKHITKLLQGTDITRELSLRVCRAALSMQEDYLLEKRKCSQQNGREPKPAKIRERVCALFGISAPTYGSIISNYLTNRSAYVSGKFQSGRSGNMKAKESRIPDTKAVQIRVREFVRAKKRI